MLFCITQYYDVISYFKWHFEKNGTFLSDVEIEKFYVLTGFIILFNDSCFVLWDAIMISIPSTARSSSIKNWSGTYISGSVRLSLVESKVENISAWVGTRKSHLRRNNSGYQGFQSRFGVQRLLYEHWQDCSCRYYSTFLHHNGTSPL